ncbi:MAG: branched-chain amino acid ABC transporter permease [Burkholderiales bacterium]
MFESQVLLQIGWTSVATSTYYVLFAVAFALTLKVAQVWNFVQAGITGLAFYTMFTALLRWGWPHWAGFLLGLAVAVAAAVACEAWGYRVLRRRRSHGLLMFIFAIVVAEFVAYLVSLLFGTEPQSLQKSLVSDVYLVGGIVITYWDLKALAITAAVCAALWAFLRYSRQGQFMHAVADNGALAELYGISANRAYVVAAVIAACLVTVGTYLYGTRASLIPTTPLELILLAVIATILGGIGSLAGAGLSAIFLSLLQSASILVIPSQWQSSLTYFVLFAVILFFPTGLKVPGWLRRGKR